jgi:predicted small lipoprotein YifL
MYRSWQFVRFAPLLLLACLSACGQKGPLYRPDERAQQVTPESSNANRKKGPTFPAPQSQKEDRVAAPPPSDPTPAPPSTDSDRGSPPPPPSN